MIKSGESEVGISVQQTNGSADKVTAETIAVSLAGATAVCALSQRVATGLGSPSAAFAITAVLSSCLASICAHLLPPDARPFAGVHPRINLSVLDGLPSQGVLLPGTLY